MEVPPRAAGARRHADRQPVRGLQSRPVGAHVLDAGFGIPGDHVGGGEVRRGIVAGGRNRHRQGIQPLVVAQQVMAGDHHLLARGVGDDVGRDRVAHGPGPERADVLQGNVQTGAVDFLIGGQRADHHGDVEAAAPGIGDVGEQEGPPIGFRDAAAELPADQRMQLGILVDGLIDGHQKPGRVQRREMLLQVAISALRQFGRRRAAGGPRHDASRLRPGGSLPLFIGLHKAPESNVFG